MSAALAEKAFDEEVGTALDEEDSLPPTQEEGKNPDLALRDRKEEAKKARDIRLAKMPIVPEPPLFSTPNRSPNRAGSKPRSQAQLPGPAIERATLPPNAPDGPAKLSELMGQWRAEGEAVSAKSGVEKGPLDETKNKLDKELLKLADEGFQALPARSVLGWRFSAWLQNHASKAEKTKYGQAKTQKAREEIRLKWAKLEQKKDLKKNGLHSESYSHVDTTLGEYMAPDMIIASQGGWGSEEAVRRGTNIISTCCRLGGDFMSWNSQSKGWDCLLLKKKFEDIYKQKWLDMYRSRVIP